jgi:HTH-type transcriptional regulator/antitoxin HigA
MEINNREDYENVMKQIEVLLQKSTQGGLVLLSEKDKDKLASLSLIAEKFEDSIPLLPIKSPSTIAEMIRLKMFEMNIKQKQLAKILEVSEARISEILSGKRKLTFDLAKKLHYKLKIDADFILQVD